MHTTNFYKKSGTLSSQRHTMSFGNHKMNFTNYLGSTDGGFTFKNNNMTTRLNNNGQCIGIGLKCGNDTTYFGKNGRVVSDLPSFR